MLNIGHYCQLINLFRQKMGFRSKKVDHNVDGVERGLDDEIYKEGESEPFDSKQVDPFGDESHADVKYRTMSWWYVQVQLSGSFAPRLTWTFYQASWHV